jgi:hypothetical protein
MRVDLASMNFAGAAPREMVRRYHLTYKTILRTFNEVKPSAAVCSRSNSPQWLAFPSQRGTLSLY